MTFQSLSTVQLPIEREPLLEQVKEKNCFSEEILEMNQVQPDSQVLIVMRSDRINQSSKGQR